MLEAKAPAARSPEGSEAKTCAFCRSLLVRRRRHALYCGGPCRAAASRARAESREAGEKAHESAQAQRTEPWLLHGADEIFAAVREAFPGSYEELPASDHEGAPLEA